MRRAKAVFPSSCDWTLARLLEHIAAKGCSRGDIAFADLFVRAGPGAQEAAAMTLASEWRERGAGRPPAAAAACYGGHMLPEGLVPCIRRMADRQHIILSCVGVRRPQ